MLLAGGLAVCVPEARGKARAPAMWGMEALHMLCVHRFVSTFCIHVWMTSRDVPGVQDEHVDVQTDLYLSLVQ